MSSAARTVHDALGPRLVALRTQIRGFRGHAALREIARQLEQTLDDMIHLARESPAITPLAKAVEDLEMELSRRRVGSAGHDAPRTLRDCNTPARPTDDDGDGDAAPSLDFAPEEEPDDFQ